MTQVSLSTSTTFDGDLNALVEDQGTDVTFRIELDQPAPAGGTRVYIDSDTVQIFNRLDLPAARSNPRVENIDIFSVRTNIDDSGLGFTINPGATVATLTLTIFDNTEPEPTLPETFDGRVDAEFFVRTASEVTPEDAEAITFNGITVNDDITIDPNAASSVVIFVDDASQLPGSSTNTPPVADNDSYSTNTDTVLSVNAADGVLNGDTDADEDSLTATITNQPTNGSATLNSDGSFTYTPNNGFSGNDSFTYIANDGTDDSNPATVNITVNDPSAEKPTVGITLDKSDVIEGETIILTINVDGEIPPEGLTVFINDVANAQNEITRSLTEFDVANVQLTGIDGFPTPAEGDSGFFVTVTESTATVTLPVLDDGFDEDEANEVFTFEVIGQDAYEIDANASSVTISITDSEVAANPRSSDFEDGTVQGWTVGQPGNHFAPPENIPSGGPDGAEDNYLRAQSEGGAGVGSRLVWFNQSADWRGNYIEDGATSIQASLINEGSEDVVIRVGFDGPGGRFVTTEGITLSPGSGWQEATFSIEPEDLTAVDGGTDVEATLSNVSQIRFLNNATPSYRGAATAAQVGVDNIAFTSTTTSLPTVSVSTTTPVVSEDESPTINVTFTVDGPIPEGGVPITIAGDFTKFFAPGFLDGNVASVINPEDGFIPIANRDPEFDINLTAPVLTFEATVFDDIIEEEPLTLDLEILGREGTLIGDNVTTITVVDGDSVIPGSGPTVSLSVSDTDLDEGDQLTVNFDTEGEIPEGGLEVFVAGGPTALGEFNIFNEDGTPAILLEGIDEFPIQGGDDGGFFVTLAENQASITLSVFDDGPTEGEETLTFELPNGEQYEVDSNAASVSLSINDGGENAAFAVAEGVTSVFLDLPLLEEAAGLTLVSTDTDATPFSENFQVGFAITEDTDFTFAPVLFAPLGGSIEHSGTITLGLNGAEATVGEFSIGYDANRVSETTSGFFVADTLEDALGLEVLFDLSAPGTATVSREDLEISGADLLLAPEVANALGLPDLAGADVGDARVDAVVEVAEDTRTGESSNDTIATATPTGVTADNPTVTINGEIFGNFFDPDLSLRTDISEDVDIYSVELDAGDFLQIDIDASQIGSELDSILQVFDAQGNALAKSDDNFAPEELFNADVGVDSYIEFTAETAGTYYVGVSSFANSPFDDFETDFYDPNVVGSGSGNNFGEYELNLALNQPISFNGEPTVVEPPDGTGPVVSFTATPLTVTTDAVFLANAVVQPVLNGEESPATSTLSVQFSTEGELPEDGVEILLNTNVALTELIDVRGFIEGSGVTIVGAIFDESGVPTGLRLNVFATTASFTLNLDNAEIVPTDGTQNLEVSLIPSAGYQADGMNFSTPIYDTLSDVPDVATSPTVSLSAINTELVESEGNTTTLTISLSEPPPAEGVLVFVDSGTEDAIREFNVFDAVITGADTPLVDDDASGFYLPMTEQTATITISAYDETVNPNLTIEDTLEGIETLTFNIASGPGYNISPETNSIDITIADNPDSVVLPDDGGNGGDTGGDTGDDNDNPENELNDTIGTATDTGLSTDNPTYTTTATLDVQEVFSPLYLSGFTDITEDVDMYAFNLEAGQTITLNVEASDTTNEEGEVEASLLAPVLRLFDDAGNEVAIFENSVTEDTVPQATNNASLEFTTTDAGTYYAGVSVLGNTFYDPNVEGTGSGWFFEDQFEPGAYELTATLESDKPQVSLSITPDVVSEADANPVVNINFTIDGDIPAPVFDADGNYVSGGLSVLYTGTIAEFFEQVTGGPDTTTLLPGPYFDAQNNIFELILLDNNATVALTILDDVIQEADETFTFNLVENNGVIDSDYSVNPEAISATFTLTDGPIEPGPTVGISVSQTELTEGDQLTVNFDVDGDIPESGLQVLVESPTTGGLGEFAIFDENGNFNIESQGIAGDPVPYDGQGSSFLVTLTEPDASLTLNVFEDGPGEGTESLTFNLVDGEAYEVNADASSVSLNISDIPEVSLSITPDVVSEEGPNNAFTATFTVDGEIPPAELDENGAVISGGLQVLLDVKEIGALGEQFDDFTVDGLAFGSYSDPERPTVVSFVLLENTSSITLSMFNDVIQEQDFDFNFELLEDTGNVFDAKYTVTDANSGSFTLVDGVEYGETTVGISLSETELTEGDELTVNFDVDGDIPSEGLQVLVQSPTAGALGEFAIFDENGNFNIESQGIAGDPVPYDGQGSSFLVTLTEPDASLTLNVFEDGPGEDTESLSFNLVDGEAYEVNADASSVSLNISDIPEVSLTVNTTTLSESEGTVLTVNFSVNGVIPEDGLEVALGGEVLPFIDQLDFTNPENFEVQGLAVGAVREDGAILLSLLEPSASLSVKVFDDILPEQDASFNFALLEGEGYSVNQEASGATITVTDGVPNANSPVVALSVSETNLTEGEEFTVNFSVDGDVSADNPLTVLVNSTEAGALGEFNIFNSDGTPAYTTTGIQGEPTVADDTGSSFFVTLTDTEASITLPVFYDGIGEGTETVNFALVDGESYGLDATNNEVTLTIEETPEEVKFETDPSNDNSEVITFAYDLTGADGLEVLATVTQEALDITDADFDNLVGFYEVVDENGGIDTDGDGVADFNPGDAGYAKAALENAIDGMALRLGGDSSDDTTAGSFGDVVVAGGKSYAPFAIANGGGLTPEEFLEINPDNNAATSVEDQVAYFAYIGANPDGANHLKSWGDGIFGFEDLPSNLAGISDNDFNDAVFQFNFTA